MHIIYYYHHRCGPPRPYKVFSNPELIYADFCVSAVSRRDSFVLFGRTSHILYTIIRIIYEPVKRTKRPDYCYS